MADEADIIQRVVAADSDDFAALLALAELDPKEDLCGLDLSSLSLSGADLRGADLSETDLRKADLRGAHLDAADLSGADLTDADLADADLSGACMTNAIVSQQQIASAFGNAATLLPDGLTCPQHWLDASGSPVKPGVGGRFPSLFLPSPSVPVADPLLDFGAPVVGPRCWGSERSYEYPCGVPENYRLAYARLREMIDDLHSILTVERLRIRPNAKTAYELLCDFGELLRRHLAEADRGLYPSLLIHEDAKVKSLAWGVISGDRPLRKSFDDYDKKWLRNCDFNFSDDLLSETNEIFEMVIRHLDAEVLVLQRLNDGESGLGSVLDEARVFQKPRVRK